MAGRHSRSGRRRISRGGAPFGAAGRHLRGRAPFARAGAIARPGAIWRGRAPFGASRQVGRPFGASREVVTSGQEPAESRKLT